MWDHRILYDPTAGGYWTAQSVYADTVLQICTGTFSFNRLEWVFTRTSPAGVVQPDDVVIFGQSIAAVTVASNLCTSLSNAQMTAVETALNTLWTTLKPNISQDYTLREWRWYTYSGTNKKPGPAARVTAVGTPGTNAGVRLPDQDAVTVTQRTASRKHWGRLYLPGQITGNIANFGLLSTLRCDDYAGAFHTFANAITTADGTPQWGVASIKYSGFLTTSQLACDNVVDVQRRRRANQATYQKVYTS